MNRAWEVLEDLENNGAGRGSTARKRPAEPAVQMSLFQPEQQLRDAVLELDVANLTPLEAINKLYELQEEARRND